MISDKKIKNIIFDFGGVLLDIDINKTIQAFEKLGIKGLSTSDIYPNPKSCFVALEMGTMSTREFFDYILENYPTDKPVSQKDLYEAWAALLLPYKEENVEMIKKLKSENYNIYLLSNTNYPHRIRFLNNFTRQFGYDMESLFDKCYYSDDLGMRKPDSQIYKHVIEDAGLDPLETMFIDDTESNTNAAEVYGIQTHFLNLKQGERVVDLF